MLVWSLTDEYWIFNVWFNGIAWVIKILKLKDPLFDELCEFTESETANRGDGLLKWHCYKECPLGAIVNGHTCEAS